jgi:hypothetical protein
MALYFAVFWPRFLSGQDSKRIGFDVAQTCEPKAGCGWVADLMARRPSIVTLRIGAAQETAREKMRLKPRQNRVNSFFLDLRAMRVRLG